VIRRKAEARLVAVVFGVGVALVLGGCSGTSATATSAGAATSATSSSSTTAAADAVTSADASASSRAGSPRAGSGAATAADSVSGTPRSSASVTVIPCERLTSAQVAVWLGSAITTTVPADLAAVGEQGDGPAIQKLDGCLYQSATGSLGYDVLSLAGWSTATQIDLVKHQIPETSGTQAFDPGIGAHSFGFTSPMGASVFAVVHVLTDDRLTTVSLTLQGATAAVARQRAVAVATTMRG
jgi:hypothetical protein